MGFLLLGVISLYLLVAVVVLVIIWRLLHSVPATLICLVMLLFGPFWRPLTCMLLFKFYERQPLQEISQVIESPISLYWQDNVWPGFDEYGRSWMIDQYLDGVHLKVLALNGEDNKIYLYRAEREELAESLKALETLKQRKADVDAYVEKNRIHIKQYGRPIEGSGDHINKVLDPPYIAALQKYNRIKQLVVKRITERVEVFDSPEQLPPIAYRVDFNIVKTGYPASSLFHSDEIIITDIKKDKIIAFSRRYMAYAFWLSKFSGNQPTFNEVLGDKQAYEFDDKVLFGYAGVNNSLDVTRDNLNKLFYKLIQ